MTKHSIKSIIAIVLSVMLIAILPVSTSADMNPLLFNADYFVEHGERGVRTETYPTYLYNGLNLPSDKIVSIHGSNEVYEFSIDGGMTLGENDVIDITSDTTVNLSGMPAKYIGIIASGNTEGGEAEFILNFEDGSEKSYIVSLSAMNVMSEYSYDFGYALVKSGSALRPTFTESTTDYTYLNLVGIPTESISNTESITFKTADFSYHVVSIAEIPYTQDELDYLKNQALLEFLPIYREETLADITAKDTENLALIMSALDSTHEDYEHIYNLLTGYPLYKAQNEIKSEYDEIMAIRDYLTAGEADIEDNEAENLDKLIELYDAQASSDRETLENIMAYFSMTDEIFLNESEKETIETLKSDYLLYKEKIELEEKISSLYSTYENKTSADLTESDISLLDELLEAYDKADNIGVSYSADERAYIEKLFRDYTNYQTSENNVHYNLEKYYNKGFVASDGETVPSDWGVNDSFKVDTDLDGTQDTTYNLGMSNSIWAVVQDENGVVAVNNYVNRRFDEPASVPLLPYDSKTNDGNTFYLSQNIGANDKNVILLSSTQGNEVTVPGSGRMAASFDLLTVGGNNIGPRNITLKINFTDGTSYNQKIYVAWAGWGSPGVNGMSESTANKLYNKNGVAEKIGSITTPSDYPDDKKAHNASAGWVVRAYSVPVEAGKIIDNIVMSGNGIILAVSERVITNEAYESLLLAQYDKVKDYTEETSDANEALLFSQCYKEGEKRGIDISKLIDTDVAESVIKKVLTADVSFEKTDKTVVTSVIKFSQPVSEDELIKNLTVSKAGTILSEYSLTMTDDKTAVIAIDDEFFGGVEYKINISENLPLKEYPTYKIARGYEFSYVSEPYLDFNAECEFEKVSKDKIKATLKFTQPVMMSELESNIKILKSETILSDSYYKVKVIDNKTAEIEITDDNMDDVSIIISVLETLKLKDYPDYTIPKQYDFIYKSPAFMIATFENGKLSITNNTKTPYDYVAVITEVSADGSEIYVNEAFADTVTDTNTHSVTLSGDESSIITASIWEPNQKVLLDITKTGMTSVPMVLNADYMYPQIDFETNYLKISGITPSKEGNKYITLDVLEKGEESLIRKQILTNKDGYFEISIPLNEDILSVGTNLTLTLGGDDFSEPVTLNGIYFSTSIEREDVIASIKNAATATEIYNIISENTTKEILSLDSKVYSNIDLNKASAVIYNNKALFSSEDTASSRDFIRRLLVLCAFNQDKKDVVSTNGYLNYEDLMNYHDINTDGENLYDMFKYSISYEGRSLIIDSLLGKDFETVEALKDSFKSLVAEAALKYPLEGGTGGSINENLSWYYIDGTLSIKGSGKMRDYTIISTAPWKEYSKYIKSVIIDDGVENIGNYAFYDCVSLTNVTGISNNLKSIGNYAFYGCGSLEKIELPEELVSIGERAFCDCRSLEKLIIGDLVTYIGSGAFYNCFSLDRINIGESVNEIGDYAFYNCYSLSCIEVSQNNAYYKDVDGSLLTIDGSRFIKYAGTASSYKIPESVQVISDGAFYNCDNLLAIEIPDSVVLIPDFAFEECSSLEKVIMGAGVKSIGTGAFKNCTALINISGGINVEIIEDEAFYSCTSLESAPIGSNVKTIGKKAFYNCAFRSIVIPDSVTEIKASAFSNCDYGVSIDIGSGLSELGDNAFPSEIGYITVSEDNKIFKSTDSGLFIKGNTLLMHACLNPATEIVIPEGVEIISDYVFENRPYILSVKLPDSLTTIGNYSFANCDGLTELLLPDNVETIGNYAFYNCNYIKSVDFSENLVSIGNYAFYSCALNSVDFSEKLVSIGNYAFYGCAFLEEIIIPDSVVEIGDFAFYRCENVKKLSLGNNVKSIGAEAFYGCISIEEIVFPDSLESIGLDAFWNCDNIKEIIIPDSVRVVGSYAFYSCDSLEYIKVGRNVKNIPRNFCSNTNLRKVIISPGVMSIGQYAFISGALEEIYIPESVESISPYAFSSSYSNAYYPQIIYGAEGSCAHEFAVTNSIYFVAVNDAISAIAFYDSEISMNTGDTVTPKLKYIPDFYADTITFTSENEDVATVNQNGLVTAVGYGTAKITATTKKGLSAELIINVIKKTQITDLSFDGNKVKTKITNVPEYAISYMSFYDKYGKLIEIKQLVLEDKLSASSDTKTAETEITAENAEIVKVFLWDMDTLKPLCESKELKMAD